MPSDLSSATLLLKMQLLGAFLETLAYGAFLILCMKSFSVLLSNDRRRSPMINNVMLGITFIQLCFITSHWVLDVVRCFDGFIDEANKPLGTLLYFLTPANPKYLAETSLYIVQGIVPDIFMIYRLYVIWRGSFWITVLPLCSVTATIVFGVGIVVKLSRSPVAADLFTPSVELWVAPALGATLFTNIWCSALIAYRIWKSEKAIRQIGAGRISSYNSSRTMHVIIDSAVLFTIVTAITFFADVTAASSVFLCSLVVASPIIGISYCLIVVRVSGNVDQPTPLGTGGMLIGSRVDTNFKPSESTDKQVPRQLGEVALEMNVKRNSGHFSDAKDTRPFDYPSVA